MTAEAPATSDKELTPVQSELDIIREINAAIAANTTQSDIRISRLAIAQPLTPECAQQAPGWKQGMIFDNLTREIVSTYGRPPWLLASGVKEDELQPCHYVAVAFNFKLPSEYIKWVPKTEQKEGGDRWEFKTLDINDPRVQQGIWVSQGGSFRGKKPPVTVNTNYMLMCLDLQLRMPLGYFRVGSFSRTSSQAGQTIASILQSHAMQNIRPWDRVYYLYTVRHDKPQTHYVLQVARGPLLKDVVDPYVAQMCLDMGRSLTGPTGQAFQTIIINAASFGEEDGHDEVSTGNSDASMQQSASDDPFANPTGADVVNGSAAKTPNF